MSDIWRAKTYGPFSVRICTACHYCSPARSHVYSLCPVPFYSYAPWISHTKEETGTWWVFFLFICHVLHVLLCAFYIDAYVSSPEKLYDNYGMAQNPVTRSGSITPVLIDEESRFRMENMERQLANLTGLVHKALNPPTVVQPTRLYNPRLNYRDYIPTRDFRGRHVIFF